VIVEGLGIDYLTEDDTQQVNGGWLRLRGKLRAATLNRDCYGFTSPTRSKQYGHIWMDTAGPSFNRANTEGKFYFLPVMIGKLGQQELGFKNHGMWLLILELVGRDKAVFRRFGVRRYDYLCRAETDKILRYEAGEDFPCEKYEDGHHHICII